MPRRTILLQKYLPTRHRWRPRNYSFGFLYGGISGSAVRHSVSMDINCVDVPSVNRCGGGSTPWINPPTAGPSSVFERILFAA